MADSIINQHKADLGLPLMQLPEDYDIVNDLNRRKLGAVVYRADALNKPQMSDEGVPLDLVSINEQQSQHTFPRRQKNSSIFVDRFDRIS